MTIKSGFWLFCAFHIFCSVFGHGQDAKEHADTIINGMVVSMDGQRLEPTDPRAATTILT
jgi:hypothetical protein